MITLSGVRSSCDIVATNSDLRWLAARRSPTRRAFCSATAAWCASPSASAASRASGARPGVQRTVRIPSTLPPHSMGTLSSDSQPSREIHGAASRGRPTPSS